MAWDAGRPRAAGLFWAALLCSYTLAVAYTAASECQLFIDGSPADSMSSAVTITSAGMWCAGAPAHIAVSARLMKQFQTNSSNVRVTNSCSTSPTVTSSSCLVTICTGTVVLRNSRVSRVRDASFRGVLCASGSSRLELHNSAASWNNATALACFDQAQLLLYASSVSHNSAEGRGGGLAAFNNTQVTVTGQSSIQNNTALAGGGLAAWHNSTVVINGTSSVHNNVASLSGGAVIAFNSSTVIISGASSVHSNEAASFFGGGLAAWDNASVTLTGNSTVHNNVANHSGGGVAATGMARVTITATSSIHDNIASQSHGEGGGGGLIADGNATVLVARGSGVHTNRATQGGGLWVGQNASATIAGGSSVHTNYATRSGGGLSALGTVTITGSSVHGNIANKYGGGVYAWDLSSVTVTAESSVYNNTALHDGGGMVADENSTVSITDGSKVHGNVASTWGGGVMATGQSRVSITGSSNVHGNIANMSGGGLGVVGVSSVTIAAQSSVYNNIATESGGGLAVGGTAKVAIVDGSSVHTNNARNTGGGLVATGNGSVTIISSYVYSNMAAFDGGGLDALNMSRLTLTANSSVHNNTALFAGGGLRAADNATVTIADNSNVHGNVANRWGGGVVAFGWSTVTITGGSSVHGNMALLDGGGVGALGQSQVTISGNSSVRQNRAKRSCGGMILDIASSANITAGSSVNDNTAYGLGLAGSGGGVCAWVNTTLRIAAASRVFNNAALNGSGGGLSVAGNAKTWILDSSILGNTCKGGIGCGISVGQMNREDSIRATTGGRWAEVAKGVSRANLDNPLIPFALVVVSNSTIANNTNSLGTGSGGGLAVAGSATMVLQNGSRVVSNRARDSSGGGAVLLENGTLRVEATVVFADNVVARGSVGASIAAYGNTTLDMPLRGNLTKCSPGVYLGWDVCRDGEILQHGACMCCAAHTFSFTNVSAASGCEPCPANAQCFGGTIVDPIPGYWRSSNRSDQMHRCPLFTDSCTTDSTGSMCRAGYQGPLCGACISPEYGMLSPLRCGKCTAGGTQLGLYIMLCVGTVIFIVYTVHKTWKDNQETGQSVRATDIIKVLVQFLQYVVIIGSVSVPWPESLNPQRWFQAASVVFGPSSGQSLSLDCLLYAYLPQGATTLPLAIQRILVHLLAPFVILVGVVVLQCCCWVVWHKVLYKTWNKPARRGKGAPATFLVWRMLPVTALVLAYYAYPTLLRAALGFFACLRIDRGPVAHYQPRGPALLNSTHGFWTLDIQQECFAGYHKGWALGLGLPLMLLLCVCVPVAMGLGLKLSQPKANIDSFKEHFGFLYRNYRPECMWWEAVWAAQTVVLTLVSVFSFPMERYLSVLGLLLVFCASASLQVFVKPYAMPSLHRLHIISTACLAATTFGALAVFAYEIRATSAAVLRMVVAVMVLSANVAFVVCCGALLLPEAKPVVGKIRKMAVAVWAKFAPWRIGAVWGYKQRPSSRKGRGSAV